jgi:hypothetical protein
MATSPQFAATPNIGSNVLSATQDSSYTAPTHTVTIVTAGSNGTKIEEVDFVGTGTTVAGAVALYLYDGSVYHYFDTVLISAVTPSTILAPFRQANLYPNLELKSGWSLVATSFAPSQFINVLAFGGDL